MTEDRHVCPVWVGYLLASPLRRLLENPNRLLAPHVNRGMTALDVGSAMGFFTLHLARMVGPEGRVVAVDMQQPMLDVLRDRAGHLLDRIETRRCSQNSLELDDYRGRVNIATAFHVVHEVPDAEKLFSQLRALMAPGGKVLVMEPPGHVSPADFSASMQLARASGFEVSGHLAGKPEISAVLKIPPRTS